MCQSLYALTIVSARSGSVAAALWNSWPANRGNDGKHNDPRTPLTFMSLTRSWMSYTPGRTSSYDVGSSCSPSARPAVAEVVRLGAAWPSNTQLKFPFESPTTRGARSSYFDGTRPANIVGGSTT